MGVLLAGALGLLLGWQLLRGRPRQAATLARLAALDSCLMTRNQQQARAATRTMRSIQQFVTENRYQAADMVVEQLARRFQARTLALTDTLRQLRQHWPPANAPAAMTRLAAQLRLYTDTIRLFVPEAAPFDLPSEALFHQDWLHQTSLLNAPRPVVVAALTRLETKVRQLGTQALQTQAEKIASHYDGFDRIGALAAPASATVAPGGVYQAKLLLALPAFGRRIMRANGRELPLDPRTLKGLVAFRIPPARPGQPDTVRAQWQGQAQFRHQLADTVLTTAVPYLIVQPTHPR